MRCHLMESIYNMGLFSPSSSKFVRPRGSPRFPLVSGRKFPYGEIFCRKNAPKARGRTERLIQKAKTATDVVHVRQRKELFRSPFSCQEMA